MRYVDGASRALTQPVDPANSKSGAAKFVEVQVAEVVNPAQAGLSFEVYFEPAGAPRVRLGTFSLFPADHPGTFIVPTLGRVNRPGKLVVVMVASDVVPAEMPLRVGIRRIALSSGTPGD